MSTPVVQWSSPLFWRVKASLDNRFYFFRLGNFTGIEPGREPPHQDFGPGGAIGLKACWQQVPLECQSIIKILFFKQNDIHGYEKNYQKFSSSTKKIEIFQKPAIIYHLVFYQSFLDSN